MELVAFLGVGKGTWTQVYEVMTQGEWDKIILIGENFARKFNHQKKFEFIEVSSSRLVELKEELLKKLKGKINGTEVALSIASGTGREHMAVISALLSLPVGIRFTALTLNGIVFL